MFKIHSKEDFTLFCSLYTDSICWLPEDAIEETDLSYSYRYFKKLKAEVCFVQIQWLKYNKKIDIHWIDESLHKDQKGNLNVHNELREEAIRTYELLNEQKTQLSNAQVVADAFNSQYETCKRFMEESGSITRAMKLELLNRAHDSMDSLIKVSKSVAMPVRVSGIVDELFLDISEKSALVKGFPIKKPSWGLRGKLVKFRKQLRELVR